MVLVTQLQVVVNIMVPFCIPIIIRHLIFKVITPKRIMILTATHVTIAHFRALKYPGRVILGFSVQ